MSRAKFHGFLTGNQLWFPPAIYKFAHVNNTSIACTADQRQQQKTAVAWTNNIFSPSLSRRMPSRNTYELSISMIHHWTPLQVSEQSYSPVATTEYPMQCMYWGNTSIDDPTELTMSPDNSQVEGQWPRLASATLTDGRGTKVCASGHLTTASRCASG